MLTSNFCLSVCLSGMYALCHGDLRMKIKLVVSAECRIKGKLFPDITRCELIAHVIVSYNGKIIILAMEGKLNTGMCRVNFVIQCGVINEAGNAPVSSQKPPGIGRTCGCIVIYKIICSRRCISAVLPVCNEKFLRPKQGNGAS